MSGADVVESMHTTFNIEAANNFQSEARDGTFAFFDGETYVASYRLRGPLPWGGWEWGAELPWVAHSSGSLDGLVDEFHELFGLPDGERSLASRGRLDYLIQSQGEVYADFSSRQQSLGDVRAFAGYQVFQRPESALALRAQIKFPTGDVGELSGSEGLDVAVWGEYRRDLMIGRQPFSLSLGGGMSYLGEGELIPSAQESWAGFGHLGVQVPVNRWLELHAQMDAHTALLDTGNPLVADAGVLGTLGGRIAVNPRFWLDLSLIEDLEAESASDVVFQVMLGTRL